MQLLYWLESVRTPFLDAVMSTVTHLGEEILFMVLAMTMMWCVDKYKGYYLLFVGFLGTQINQLLKVTFRIDRPWVKDPDFTIVESARAEATGYSFPSGHTQSSVGTFGASARLTKRLWVRVLCIAACIAVPFSRMYLGVHTPLDVGVSIIIAVTLVLILYPVIEWAKTHQNGMRILILIMIALSLAQALWLGITLHGAVEEELQNGVKSSFKMLGATLGFFVGYELDMRCIRFETKAVWWAQIIKVVLGLALTLAVKELAYLVFGLIPNEPVNRALSYFTLTLFASAAWPLTFKWFGKLGK